MVRKILLAVLAATALGGCVSDGYYGGYGGGGDYYYGHPSADYYYDDYGYPGYGYGSYGYRHGYGYGYPYYGYGGYWDYPYYWPPYYPRPPHDDDDGPHTGGNLPPSRADRDPQAPSQPPRAIARPRLTDGVDTPWRTPPRGSGLRPGVGDALRGGREVETRVRSPRQSAPLAPRAVMPAPRSESRPPMPVRSMPRERVSRPPASRERDTRQEVER